MIDNLFPNSSRSGLSLGSFYLALSCLSSRSCFPSAPEFSGRRAWPHPPSLMSSPPHLHPLPPSTSPICFSTFLHKKQRPLADLLTHGRDTSCEKETIFELPKFKEICHQDDEFFEIYLENFNTSIGRMSYHALTARLWRFFIRKTRGARTFSRANTSDKL